MKNKFFYCIILWVFCFSIGYTQKIKHRFIAKGESRSQLHYIDEFDASNNWTIDIGMTSRDIHLIDNNRILVSCKNGFIEFDLKARKKVFEIHRKEFLKTETVLRLENGNTLLGLNNKQNAITIVEITREGTILKRVDFPNLKTIRLLRLSPEGHFLFGANKSRLIETDWKGHVYANIEMPDAEHVYWIRKITDNLYRATTGYGATFVEINSKGDILKKLGGKSNYNFFSRPFEMSNGNIVISNWTGHDWNAGKKGVQLIEFDTKGNIVWKWHRADLAGSIHGVIVLE